MNDLVDAMHAGLAVFGALLDGLSAALTAIGLGYLTSDDTAPTLLSAIPFGALVVIVSATIWRNAVCLGSWLPVYVHVPVILGALGIILVGYWLAQTLFLYAAEHASPDDINGSPPTVQGLVAINWPLAWAFAAFIGWHLIALVQSPRYALFVLRVRSILAGLALGFAGSVAALPLATYLYFTTISESQSCCPRDYSFPSRHGGQLDVLIMLLYLTVSSGFGIAALIGASRRASERTFWATRVAEVSWF